MAGIGNNGVKRGLGKKTVARQAAKALANDAQLETIGEKGPLKAPAGIEPVELMLANMRSSWILANKLGREAKRLKLEAAPLPQGPEKDQLNAKALDLANSYRIELDRANSFAVQVAPYRSPKLTSTDSKIIGNLTIELAKF